MERWAGRVALITGASSGIGAGILKRLVKDGMKVVGCARNVERIESLGEELKKENAKGTVTAIKCDVRKKEDIMNVFKQIRSEFGVSHVCINNAGLIYNAPLLTGDPEQWRELLEVNVLAPSIFTKEAVKLMRENNIDDGHIINISSMSGHRVTDRTPHMHAATKHTVVNLTEGVRRELRKINSHIRITFISPGFVNTKFGDPIAKITEMEVEDIAETTVYVLSSHPRVEVHGILIRPTEQIQ